MDVQNTVDHIISLIEKGGNVSAETIRQCFDVLCHGKFIVGITELIFSAIFLCTAIICGYYSRKDFLNEDKKRESFDMPLWGGLLMVCIICTVVFIIILPYGIIDTFAPDYAALKDILGKFGSN